MMLWTSNLGWAVSIVPLTYLRQAWLISAWEAEGVIHASAVNHQNSLIVSRRSLIPFRGSLNRRMTWTCSCGRWAPKVTSRHVSTCKCFLRLRLLLISSESHRPKETVDTGLSPEPVSEGTAEGTGRGRGKAGPFQQSVHHSSYFYSFFLIMSIKGHPILPTFIIHCADKYR